MAAKKMGKAEMKAIADKVGIDLSKVDFAKWLQIVTLILSALQQKPAPQAAKAAGCAPDDHEACCACHEAAALALESAKVSLQCCADMAGGGDEDIEE